MTGRPVSFEELLISALDTNDAVAKLPIDKGIIMQAELTVKIAKEQSSYQWMLNPTPQ